MAPNSQTLVRVKFMDYLSGSCDVYYEPDLSSFPGCLGAKSVHKRDVKIQYCSIMNLNAVLLPLDTCIGTVRDCQVNEWSSGCSSDATGLGFCRRKNRYDRRKSVFDRRKR